MNADLFRRFAISAPLLLAFTAPLCAQVQSGEVQGVVTDSSGALVPAATVVLSNNQGLSRTVRSGADGKFSLDHVVPGRYALAVTADGFARDLLSGVLVYSGRPTAQNVVLKVAADEEKVEVNSNALGVDTDPANNASALVIKGKDLDALSDDPDQLQDELTALAGPSAGPSGGQIYIDGFTGGQLPPKSSIREIRVNQNPFSAQYDKLGYGRIEILTKPGTDKFHGSVMINGNDSAFNSLNPFVTSEPPYYSTFAMANASGSLSKTASWFGSVFQRNNSSNSIVSAVVPDSAGNAVNYNAAVANPQSRLDISPRFDFQLGAKNTVSIRYMFDSQKQTNSGVTGLALQSQAYNVSNHENTVQISDTQILRNNLINEARFQYLRSTDNQVATDTTPTETVQGAFTGGGNNTGTVRDTQDRYELQDYVSGAFGRHSLNFGTRLRLTHENTYSTSGFNGAYVYQSLAAYAAKTPSQYQVTAGNPNAAVNLFDAALFFQDDWKVRPNLTLSYGLRYEGQNRIHDLSNWAPRLLLAYSPNAHGKPGKTVFRVGYGWFFDRFSSSYVLDAIRQNGINQQQYVVKDPTFSDTAPSTAVLAASSTGAPTIYQLAPNLKASLNMQGAVGVDRQFGKFATVSATYLNSRGVHQYLTDNVNAFLPGTYDTTTGTGVRPDGVNENLYQFQSGGVYNQNQLVVNYTVRAKRVSLFGFYTLNFAKADTSGATYTPSNQFNPGADYGRASFDVRNRFLLGGNWQAPFGVSFSPMLVANSGTPFNITLGQDLNGDNEFNDRPAYATAASSDVLQTTYGAFDLNPPATVARVPYNLGNGPAEFSMNLRLSKSFGIGPRAEGGVGNSGGGPGGPGGAGGGPGGPGGGHGGGGGLGPGGLSGNGGPPKLDADVPRKYSLTVSAMGRNIFNNVNLAAPVGVLSSPLFGRSNALAGGFFSSPAANRSIDLQMRFSF